MDTKGFEHICAFIGPGASDGVLPTEVGSDVPSTETKKPRSGYAYAAAGGHRIANEGQKDITFVSQEGSLCRIDLQVAAVNKALGSVAEFVDTGHRITSEKSGAHIDSVGGHRAYLRRCNEMW